MQCHGHQVRDTMVCGFPGLGVPFLRLMDRPEEEPVREFQMDCRNVFWRHLGVQLHGQTRGPLGASLGRKKLEPGLVDTIGFTPALLLPLYRMAHHFGPEPF